MAWLPAAFVLADGRLPWGGHAHSGGVEAAVAQGWVHDLDSLAAFARGRLVTTGLTDAALAAATVLLCGDACVPWAQLDREASVRIASPALRQVSRRLGAQLLRVARTAWDAPRLDELATAVLPPGPHRAVALGAAAAAAGLPPETVAVCAAHDAVVSPCAAAVRLLGLDPFGVARVIAGLGEQIAAVAAEAAEAAHGPLRDLPAPAGVLADVMAEDHARWEVRLFAS
ncbi:MAG: urease accessory protein UreF [Egibacteraceae bacterium]